MLSGLLQEGYAAGNVLAARRLLLPLRPVGWRPLFFLGSLPGHCCLCSSSRSASRNRRCGRRDRVTQSWARTGREILSHWKLFLYLLAFMTMMLFASHGTQDMYPTFLQRQWHFAPRSGRRSRPSRHRRHSRRPRDRSFVGQVGPPQGNRHRPLCWRNPVIPLWAYAPIQALLVIGAFLMQFMVQGAWGVIPAHCPNSRRIPCALCCPDSPTKAPAFASSVVYIEALCAEDKLRDGDGADRDQRVRPGVGNGPAWAGAPRAEVRRLAAAFPNGRGTPDLDSGAVLSSRPSRFATTLSRGNSTAFPFPYRALRLL